MGYVFLYSGTEEDECYRCSNFDALGRGFIEAADNPPMCGHYRECYKAKDTGVITSVDRWCAPGTYTDPEDILRGAPCTRTSCNPDECHDCDVFPTVSTPAWCTYLYDMKYSHTLCCGFQYETYIGISPYRTLAVDSTQSMVV